MVQWVKNLPEMQEMQETQVQSLGQEGPLEEGRATPSSVLAWRMPWTEETGGLHEVTKSWTQLKGLSMHSRIWEGNRKRKLFFNYDFLTFASSWREICHS